jgi:hypothetical protein
LAETTTVSPSTIRVTVAACPEGGVVVAEVGGENADVEGPAVSEASAAGFEVAEQLGRRLTREHAPSTHIAIRKCEFRDLYIYSQFSYDSPSSTTGDHTMLVPISTTALDENDPRALQAMYADVFASDPRTAALNQAWAASLGAHCAVARGNPDEAAAYLGEVERFGREFEEPRVLQHTAEFREAYGIAPATRGPAGEPAQPVAPHFAPSFAPVSGA